MKIYFDAGLKQLANLSGHRGETLKALSNCTNFKRTHREAFYMYMLDEFLKVSNYSQEIKIQMKNALNNYSALDLDHIEPYFKAFYDFASDKAMHDPNWCFWSEYILSNCCGYINLFLAVRSANWYQRIASLKVMAPVFLSFDRTTYRKLIPQHIADCLLLPQNIKTSFQNGGFSISIYGNR